MDFFYAKHQGFLTVTLNDFMSLFYMSTKCTLAVGNRQLRFQRRTYLVQRLKQTVCPAYGISPTLKTNTIRSTRLSEHNSESWWFDHVR